MISLVNVRSVRVGSVMLYVVVHLSSIEHHLLSTENTLTQLSSATWTNVILINITGIQG